VRADEGFDRDERPLWDVHVATWEGFVFVNASADPPPLLDVLRDDPEEPMQFERYGMGELRIGSAATYDTAANWKIVIDNYNECLHCPSVHPELVTLIPVYRRGTTVEDPESWGVMLREGATSLTRSGLSSLPPLPGIEGEDRHRYYGCHIFPNLFLDLTSDNVTYDILLPDGPGRTLDTGGYLLHPDTLATDPDLSDIIEFGDLVSRQDIAVCERAQMGVGSRAFAEGGTLVPKDRDLGWFRDRYLEIMDA
jgi:Rieske 2Fe-2S family protein